MGYSGGQNHCQADKVTKLYSCEGDEAVMAVKAVMAACCLGSQDWKEVQPSQGTSLKAVMK